MELSNMSELEFREYLREKIVDEMQDASENNLLPELPDKELDALRRILIDICAIMETENKK